MPLNQVDKAVRDAARYAVDQEALLPAKFAIGKKLLPPMGPEG
jgi:hypothetical protein